MITDMFTVTPDAVPIAPEAGRITFRTLSLGPDAVPYHVTTPDRASAAVLRRILKSSPDVEPGSVLLEDNWTSADEAMSGMPGIHQDIYILGDDGKWTHTAGTDTDGVTYKEGQKGGGTQYDSGPGRVPLSVHWDVDAQGHVFRISVTPDVLGAHRI